MPRDLSQFFARPIAHRGLHDAGERRAENSLGAARAAIARHYAIECDAQLSADGEAMVFHDDRLERLTSAEGPLADRSAGELSRLTLQGSNETLPTLRLLLETIAGRTPLVIELKSCFDGDLRLARRVAALAACYEGPIVIESFDPDPIAFLREAGASLDIAHIPLGIVAQGKYSEEEWPQLSKEQRAAMTHFLHFSRTRPQFLSFDMKDFPHVAPVLFRQALRAPVTAWTARSQASAKAAQDWADQIVFEGFAP